MSDRSSSSSSSGIGVCGATFVALLVLKFTGYFQYSWFWVFLPLFLPIIILFLILGVIGILYVISKCL